MANRFPGREVAHVWNSQNQPEGQNNNGQFFFTGRGIYSYGKHFLAGFIMPDGVVLLNASHYSITTSKHMSFVNYATYNRRQLYVPNLTALDYALRSRTESGIGRSNKATVRDYLAKNAAKLSEEAGVYVAAAFGLSRSWPAIQRKAEREAIKAQAKSERVAKARALADAKTFAEMTAESFALNIPDDDGRDVVTGFYTVSLEQFAKRLARAHKAASAAGQMRRKAILWERLKAVRAFSKPETGVLGGGERSFATTEAIRAEKERRRIEAERLEAERRADWLAGKGNGRFSDPDGGALLRIVGDPAEPEGAELETSHGARVPLAHAIKAFRFVKLIRETGGHWQRNGRTVRVGHYQLDAIDPDGFTAGCHRINWPEIERVAKLAGVFDCPASDAAAEPSHVAA